MREGRETERGEKKEREGGEAERGSGSKMGRGVEPTEDERTLVRI
jgi:hypothetical protein